MSGQVGCGGIMRILRGKSQWQKNYLSATGQPAIADGETESTCTYPYVMQERGRGVQGAGASSP